MSFDCSEVSGDREVQRTMLELLNQLDGFSSDDRIKVSLCVFFFFFHLVIFISRVPEHFKSVEFGWSVAFGLMKFVI